MASIIWRVQPAPKGRYRSFDRRGFPQAYFITGKDEHIVAEIICTRHEYAAWCRESTELELKVRVYLYSLTDNGRYKTHVSVSRLTFNSINEAKAWHKKFINAHPEHLPQEDK